MGTQGKVGLNHGGLWKSCRAFEFNFAGNREAGYWADSAFWMRLETGYETTIRIDVEIQVRIHNIHGGIIWTNQI